ncbi:MAG TPA: tripartite tricarboxylate transporter substrate binding protein [Xanthobacteraceae bacterium]|nr:tripartite tricarboxylate transporter substrate binding protein [Xanthobacteraceae bacterium]
MARVLRGGRSDVTRIPRRHFLRLAGAAAVFGSRAVRAQAYPSQPIRWIVGFPPGGGADIVSRIMAAWLAERLGQSVFVENKPGASTNLSLQTAVNAAPDGHTLVFVAASAAVNVSLFKNLTFDLRRDIAPVAGLVDFPLVLLANPQVPVKTVAELIAYAKANPGKVSIGSFGTGTTSHVAGELFKQLAGIDMVHVPYRGGAALATDLMAGRVQAGFDVLTGELPHIQAGAIRALAMAGRTRYPALPDVPTIAETMPLYVANSWCGVGVPRGTPPAVVARLNYEINAGLGNPAVRGRLDEVAATPMPLAPDAFGAYVGSEIDKWAQVIQAANIKVE